MTAINVAGRPLAQTPPAHEGELRDVAASGVGNDAPQAVGVRPDNSIEDGPDSGGTRRTTRGAS